MRAALILFLVVLLAGCKTGVTYTQKYDAGSEILEKHRLFVRISLPKESLFTVEKVPDPEAATRLSYQNTAAMQSTTLPAGTSQGEAALGYLLGTLVVRELHKENSNTVSREAEKKLSQSIDYDLISSEIDRTIRHKFQFQGWEFEAKGDADHLVEMKLRYQLSSDMVTLKLLCNLEVFDRDGKELRYRNSFEYWSMPLDATMWSPGSEQRLLDYTEEALESIHSMIRNDLYKTAGEYSGSEVKTLKISTEAGTYIKRGSLLRSGGERVVYRNLRGNVFSVHGNMVSL